MAKKPQDLTRYDLRGLQRRVGELEAKLDQTRAVIALLAQWISETLPGDQALSRENAQQIQEKLR